MARAVEPKILYEEDPTLLTSTVQVVVLAGTADDPPGKNGLANFLSELTLRGTKKKGRAKFQSEIERMGASLSVRTSPGATVYVGRVIKENTIPFLKLLSEALLEPAFTAPEFEDLKREILAEISHLKNNNGRLSGLAVRRTLYAGTALERPTEGSLKSVKSLKRDDVLRAYNNHFNRGSFVFGVASPLKQEEVAGLLTQTWLKFPDGLRRSRRSFPVQAPKKPTLVVVHKPKTSTGAIMFGQAGITAQDEARYALSVTNFAFGGEPLVSRLFRVIRSELGWTYAVGSTYHATGALTDQQGFYIISSTPAMEYSAKTILKILAMWKEFLKSGLKDDELRVARESLVNSYPFEFDSAEKRLWQRMHSHLYGVPVLSPEEYAGKIESLSKTELTKIVAEKQLADGWLISIVADREIFEKQLADEQKDVPPNERLAIARQLVPDDLIQ